MLQKLIDRADRGLPLATLLLMAGCASASEPAKRVAVAPTFRPVATIQDLMESEIDPAADFIWGSLGTIVTHAGTEVRQPHSTEQWNGLRRQAIVLLEATNLLLIPGRRVTSTPFASVGSGVLSSTEIQRHLLEDRRSFDAFALALGEVAGRQLVAIEHHDVDALSEASEALDEACEACHVAHWYPHQVIPPLPDFR